MTVTCCAAAICSLVTLRVRPPTVQDIAYNPLQHTLAITRLAAMQCTAPAGVSGQVMVCTLYTKGASFHHRLVHSGVVAMPRRQRITVAADCMAGCLRVYLKVLRAPAARCRAQCGCSM